MKPKHIELIKLLIEKPSNATRLSELLDVSVRSVRNYVKQINQAYPETILASTKGYHIDQNQALEIIQGTRYDIPQTSKERVYFIITKLLNSNRKTATNVHDICEELFISLSTLKTDLNKVRGYFGKFDLALDQSGDWLKVQGLEKNKRKMLSAILYEESSINFVNIESLQKAFSNIDIQFVKNTILQTLDKYHYYINDYSLINLVLHTTIAIDRIMNQSIQRNTELPSQMPIHEFRIAQDIANQLSSQFRITYDIEEVNELSLLIASRATSLDYQNISKTNIETYIGKECLDIVNHLIESINAFYHINLFDDEFIVRFALHTRNLLVRAKNNQFSKNPLAEGIKKTSPLIYETSVSVASELKLLTGITINDDEIAYIAFHIGSAIETVESLKEKIKVVYYCPNYYNIQDNIMNFIKEHFDSDIVITNVITDESAIDDLSNTDFILTAIPIATVTIIPIVQVSIFPNDNDRIALTKIIIQTRKNKEKNQFEENLRTLIVKNLFKITTEITTYDACVPYLANELINLNYVEEEFLDDVLEREKLSSTAFLGAAIPHSMHMNANKTALSILINPNGIDWNGTEVNIVIMMCFQKNERFLFNEVFEPITMILAEKENLTTLINVSDYEAFIETMVGLI